MDLIDWGLENGLEDQRDTTKCEFVLLASVSSEPDRVSKLRIREPVIQAQAAVFMPRHFKAQSQKIRWLDHPEVEWTVKALDGDPYIIVLQEHSVLMAHEVFWASRFGQVPVRHPEAARRVISALGSTTDPDTVALLLVACVGLEVEPPESAEDMILTGLPGSWADYHPHLVADYYRLIKERR